MHCALHGFLTSDRSTSNSNSTQSTAMPGNDYCSDQESHPEDVGTHSGAGMRTLHIPSIWVLCFCPNVRILQLRMRSHEFFFLSPALYINYLCTRSNNITLSFPTSAQKRSWKSFYASLNLSPESLQTHLDSAASSPALAPLHHLSITHAASLFTHDSDHDSNQDALADSESDGDDDEYIPFVETNPRKCSHSSIPIWRNVSPSPSSHHNHHSVKHACVSPSCRNKQASLRTSAAIREAVSAVSCHQMNFICPECGWKQTNRRMPDFKRHIKTHMHPTEDDQSKGGGTREFSLRMSVSTKESPTTLCHMCFWVSRGSGDACAPSVVAMP